MEWSLSCLRVESILYWARGSVGVVVVVVVGVVAAGLDFCGSLDLSTIGSMSSWRAVRADVVECVVAGESVMVC